MDGFAREDQAGVQDVITVETAKEKALLQNETIWSQDMMNQEKKAQFIMVCCSGWEQGMGFPPAHPFLS